MLREALSRRRFPTILCRRTESVPQSGFARWGGGGYVLFRGGRQMVEDGQVAPPSALGHLRVLEIVNEVGEFCGKLMADLGADVVRVEPPGGASTRQIGPFLGDDPGPERSIHFWQYNANKRSITLNLDETEGQALLARLAGRADILIESMPPGYMDDRGLLYEQLRESNPGLVYASVSAFGRGGPRGNFKGGDLAGWASSGYMYTTGWTWHRPTRPWGRQASHAASLYAVTAALGAVFNRWSTGEGQHVDVSLQEAVASTVEQDSPFYVGDNVISGRRNNDHANGLGSTKILPCADGWVHLNGLAWRNGRNRIVEWIADDGMAEDLIDEKWHDDKYRRANLDHLLDVVTAWTKTKTRAEFFHAGQERGLECGPITNVAEAIDDPQLKHREFWVDVEHPEVDRTFTYPGAPYMLSETPWSMRHAAPSVGRDNADVFTRELGLSEDELARLRQRGIV
ncbi:MAG TPA: hypothetical protein DCP37_08260 [Dehalococcoidia bacterium]|nr:hypothetical protein [Dehalococcoidia bacterium]